MSRSLCSRAEEGKYSEGIAGVKAMEGQQVLPVAPGFVSMNDMRGGGG